MGTSVVLSLVKVVFVAVSVSRGAEGVLKEGHVRAGTGSRSNVRVTTSELPTGIRLVVPTVMGPRKLPMMCHLPALVTSAAAP
jgi:hypothetical protein